MMNNEDKAKELYRKYRDTNFAPESAAFNAAMEMAEWKEEQMIDWVRKNAHRYIDTDNDSEGHLCEKFLEDAFVDDFKKAMKGE